MKTPRFFIVLAACAVVFTIALTSIESAFRPCRAETLPVLRLDPRAGDPDQPGGSYREIPFEDSYGLSQLETSSEIKRAPSAPMQVRAHTSWWLQLRGWLHVHTFAMSGRWLL
jgi:hypothetical protein